ncbi:hypothetical protein [Flavobacterium sp. 3HN19-14]|uniref:hypothetical protein n=1 Tax=Flavobacterium sp. 3HN19-14 TaxID=3448133 RepID=UPI003EE18D5F
MKTLKSLLFLFVLLAAGNAQSQSVFEKWPSIKAFHEVLSATFHPAEKGDLKPIKARYEELALKAEDVLKSTIPAEYQTKEILASAERLQIKTKALQKKMATNADDATIMKQLNEIHDTFHEIVGLCSGEKH